MAAAAGEGNQGQLAVWWLVIIHIDKTTQGAAEVGRRQIRGRDKNKE